MATKVVYVLDDNQDVCESLASLLKALKVEVFTFSSAESFVTACDETQPFGALIDVRMPGINGLELLSILRQRGWQFRVVIMTGHGDVDMAVRAMKLGATDFLQKPFAPDRLLELFDLQNPSTTAELATEPIGDSEMLGSGSEASSPRDRLGTLSPREREVLQLIRRGLTSREIGDKLQISPATVNNHRTQIRDKLNAKSLAHLLAIVNEASI